MRVILLCILTVFSIRALEAQICLRSGHIPIKIGPLNSPDADLRISDPYFTGLEFTPDNNAYILKFYSDSFTVRESGVSYFEPVNSVPHRIASFLTRHPGSDVLAFSQDASVIVVRRNGNYNDCLVLQNVSGSIWKLLCKISNKGADFGMGYACLTDSNGKIWLLIPDSNEGRGKVLLFSFAARSLRYLGDITGIFIYSAHNVVFTTQQGSRYECR